ncbi:MAG TPA: M36 family metallopeptidase [Blastocatellia bacterium]|nr:M36 family metallopeptidase [Blastocatellia bacterium]
MKRYLPPAIAGCGLLCVVIGFAAQPDSVSKFFRLAQTTAAAQTQATQPDRSGRRAPQTRGHFDLRATHLRSLEAPPEEKSAAGRTRLQEKTRFRLQREHSGVQLRWSSLTRAASRVWSLNENLSAPSREDGEAVARRFLKENEDLFRLSRDEVDELKVARRFTNAHNGVTHLLLQQQVNGIEVFQSEMAIHLDRNGSVLAASGELIPSAARAVNLTRPKLTAAAALQLAASDVGAEISGPLNSRMRAGQQTFDRTIGFGREVEARLVYFPISGEQVRLGWQFLLWMKDTPDVYLSIIDAERGSLLWRYNLTCYDENPLRPHGPVFTGESPHPNLPRRAAGPVTASRSDLPFHAAPFNGVPTFAPDDVHFDWWSGLTADNLTSNNASVALDLDADNLPDAPELKAPDGNFTFPLDLGSDPLSDNNQRAAQVNLFYWINRYHDILYSFGFTEAAGNFQIRNFGRGGMEGDAIAGDVQDGSGLNNANFTTPPDGGAGRVQMYLWLGNPKLDSALDQTVILHELTHGLSNRLIGNATGLGALQSAGMGEGWSDYFALALLASEGDDLNGAYPLAQYVSGNYQRGIRRYPYSTDLSLNPLTYGRVSGNTQVHAVGEIWCSVLWELRAALIRKYGFSEGQRQSIQLVVDGMKLTPRTPSFIDARNAILLADRINNGGANQCVLWQAFAKRGLGYSADTLDATDPAPAEAFDSVPWCSDTATLRLDRDSYLNGETVQITLSDHNAALPVRVQVRSSATGDSETLTLDRGDETPGRFRGALRVVAGRAVAGDGELQASVEAGDQLSVFYSDSSNDSGTLSEVTVTSRIAREKTVFEDTVEKGNQGWITNGAWGITAARAVSGTHCWTDSPGRNYYNGESTWLTSPLFDLSGTSDVVLSFAQAWQLDQGLDACLVEYSTDDGVTWARAAAFNGAQTTFVPARIRLRGLDGQARARIRFRLQSDLQAAGDGWYIDDIRLTARSASAAVIAPGSAQPPVITAVSPAFGSPAGGTEVTISGANFTEESDTAVMFDGVSAAAVRVLSATTLVITTPPHLAGAVTVSVNNRNGQTGLAEGFTYFTSGSSANPTLGSLAPASGSVRGGTQVKLFGSGFTPETAVSFGAQKAAVTFINSQTLRAIAPAAAAPGAVDVTVSQVVADTAAAAKLASAFSYVAATPPSVQVLSPKDGEVLYAGSTINLTWHSSDNRALAKHRLRLWREANGTPQLVYELATDVAGEAQSFAWPIPADLPQISRARLSVIATDDEGAETEAFSGGWFTISRRWESAVQLPASMQDFAVVSDGTYLYTIGGRSSSDATTALSTLQRVDPTASRPAWRATGLAQMPVAEAGAGAVLLGGRIHVPGGLGANNRLLVKHQVYDIAANQWDQAAELPAGVINYALAADEARGVYYLTGGSESVSLINAVNRVRVFDPINDRWSELPPMKTARQGHQAALIAGRLYVIGGAGASGMLSDGEVYDFSSGQWSAIAPLNRPRQAATSVIGKDPAGNPLWFIIGGWDGSETLPGVEVYDVGRNRWIALDDSFNLPTPRSWLGGAALAGFFYAIGGFTVSPTNVGARLLISQRQNERLLIDGITPVSFDQAPVLAVPEEQTAVAESEISFSVLANDLGSNVPLALTAADLPAGANFKTTVSTSNSVRGTFRWQPSASEAGRTFTIAFTASDGQLSETKLVRVRVVEGTKATAVNAADYGAGVLAADSIAAIFGVDLTLQTRYAGTQPLPKELAGTTVRINGIAAQLLFVSPTQINFIVPPAIEPGRASIIVCNPAGSYAVGSVEIVAAAPALFTVNATGRGDAAAVATPDGVHYQAAPFDVTVNGRPNNLVLYGTGLRGAQSAQPKTQNGLADAVTVTIEGQPARVLYAGAQGTFSGLDQINVELPPALAGKGERRAEVVLSVNGTAANRVTVLVR